MPDKRSLNDELELEASRIFGNGDGPDEVDGAIATLRKAREVLDDATMMRAIKQRLDENKAAVADSMKDDDDG